MKKYDSIIIGSGASGCMCALTTKNKSVALIDNNNVVAKKILVTGNGKCNLTNLNTNSTRYNTNIDKFLNKFGVTDTLNFFKSYGLETYADEDNRVYPISNSAKSVLDILEHNLKNKVDTYLNSNVTSIEKTTTGFKVYTDNDVFESNKLVIATGGNSIVNALTQLNIKFDNFTPSLVALKTNSTKALTNVRLSNVKVTATSNNKTMVDCGEVLFKDSGVSGIVVFNLSTLFARTQNYNGSISIDILPNIETSKLIEMLTERKKLNVVVSKFFVGLFQNQVAEEIFKQSKVNTNLNSTKLTNADIEDLANTIKNLTFTVNGCYDNNQVYCGGVNLNGLTDNLEYIDIPNLYFTGEICNVDGECGGYNLQWAWTSGHIVGELL